MPGNNTCLPGDNTTACPTKSSPAGLAAGLTIFFLLLAIAGGLIVYRYRNIIMDKLNSRRRRGVNKEEYIETPQAEPHPYSSMKQEQQAAPTPTQASTTSPIYENLARDNRQEAKQSRSSREAEEDLYLQYDEPDEAIYSNDPACNLSLLPESLEEDVYVVPNAD